MMRRRRFTRVRVIEIPRGNLPFNYLEWCDFRLPLEWPAGAPREPGPDGFDRHRYHAVLSREADSRGEPVGGVGPESAHPISRESCEELFKKKKLELSRKLHPEIFDGAWWGVVQALHGVPGSEWSFGPNGPNGRAIADWDAARSHLEKLREALESWAAFIRERDADPDGMNWLSEAWGEGDSPLASEWGLRLTEVADPLGGPIHAFEKEGNPLSPSSVNYAVFHAERWIAQAERQVAQIRAEAPEVSSGGAPKRNALRRSVRDLDNVFRTVAALLGRTTPRLQRRINFVLGALEGREPPSESFVRKVLKGESAE